MRTLTIGTVTLELRLPFSKKWDRGAGVYAEIAIPTTAISHDDLKALFTDNTEDLIVTEEDGSTETFSGYTELHEIKENISMGVYIVTQYCTGTAMHLLNEARKQIETLQTEKAELQSTVATQGQILTAQAEQIVTQANSITELNGTIENQNETITAQAAEIEMLNDTLLAVIMG